MQRWIFDNASSDATVGESIEGSSNARKPVGNDGRLHTFRVLVNQRLEPGERVAVTGECSSLGRWSPTQCVQLNLENGEFRTADSPKTNDIFICGTSSIIYFLSVNGSAV